MALAAARVTAECAKFPGPRGKAIADLMSIALWVSTLNQTVARAPGIKVMDRPLRLIRPQQAVAAPPTSLPSYSLLLLFPIAARLPLRPLKLTWALARVSQPKPLRLCHRLPFAL